MFRAQCKFLVKDLVEDAKGVKRWEYKKRVPNHFGMALNSLRLADELYRGVRVDYGQLHASGIKRLAPQAPAVLEDEPARPLAWRREEAEEETSLARGSADILEAFSYR
jgi:hypothetical protein